MDLWLVIKAGKNFVGKIKSFLWSPGIEALMFCDIFVTLVESDGGLFYSYIMKK